MTSQILAQHDVADLLGLHSVVVESLPALVCPECDEILLLGKLINNLSTDLVNFILLGSFALTGLDVRFLRKAMGLTQQVLAERLGVEPATVSRWESEPNDAVPYTTSIALRTVLAASEKSTPPSAEN
jgi:YgiT-type zinc finger domain-containing protein